MTDREQKIINNMNLVHYIVHKHFPQYTANQDVIQNGYIGLIKAVDSFHTVLANSDRRDDPLTIEDILAYEDDYTSMYIQEFVRCLDEREITVLKYLMDGKTQAYASNQLGMTRSNICRIVKVMRSKWKECYYKGGNYES